MRWVDTFSCEHHADTNLRAKELALSSHTLANAQLVNWSGDLLRLFGEDTEIRERSLEKRAVKQAPRPSSKQRIEM